MTQDLLESIEDGIATLTMNRPEARNAFTREMMDALSEALPRLALDPAVRLVVLTGAGRPSAPAATSRASRDAAGAPAAMSFDTKVTDLRARMEVARWLHEMPKPTLAVIPGPAAGAGLSLALACDLRIAADDAKLTTAFAKVGLSGDFGGTYFLNHLVGAAKARELYFTGQVIRGAEAQRIGLVNRAVPAAQLAEAARAWAAERRRCPRGAGLHEAQPQHRPARLAVRRAGRRGAAHDPHLRDRRPQGRGGGLRREARAELQGALNPAARRLRPRVCTGAWAGCRSYDLAQVA